MMISPNQQAPAPSDAEYTGSDPEMFLPLENMERVVRETLEEAGRIDEHGRVLPITVERRLHEPGFVLGSLTDPAQRSDVFVPTADERKLYEATDETGIETKNKLKLYTLESCLYTRLTGTTRVQLSEAEIAQLTSEKQDFESFFAENPDYKIHLDKKTQFEDAYHINALQKSDPEFAATRLYIPAGVGAIAVAHTVFEQGARMNYAKIWIQGETTHPQVVRHDTPIFEVTTHDQLKSVIPVLRELSEDGWLPDASAPLVGQEIDGLPGVYLGQRRKGESFNGDMGDILGKAVQGASERVKLRAGDVVDSDILGDIAERARLLAQANASKIGRDTSNHAFLANQPVADILKTIRQA